MARWLSWLERRPVTAKVVGLNQKNRKKCTSGSVVEYRLAKARVAGSNPVSCSLVFAVFMRVSKIWRPVFCFHNFIYLTVAVFNLPALIAYYDIPGSSFAVAYPFADSACI